MRNFNLSIRKYFPLLNRNLLQIVKICFEDCKIITLIFLIVTKISDLKRKDCEYGVRRFLKRKEFAGD